MTDYKEKIQRLQQLVNKQEDKIVSLTNELIILEDKVKGQSKKIENLGIISQNNSSITPLPVFSKPSITGILKDRNKAIKKMNKRNRV